MKRALVFLVACSPLLVVAQSTHPFTPVGQVLLSPRCMNCHPAGDAPLQTDASKPHKQNIKRSFVGLGGSCQTCHMPMNLKGEHMPPGAPDWRMPPPSMVFEGKTASQLCADLKDPTKNGGRTLEMLREHMHGDPLVLWGFAPGDGRTLPPLSKGDFDLAVDAWVQAGGPCP